MKKDSPLPLEAYLVYVREVTIDEFPIHFHVYSQLEMFDVRCDLEGKLIKYVRQRYRHKLNKADIDIVKEWLGNKPKLAPEYATNREYIQDVWNKMTNKLQ